MQSYTFLLMLFPFCVTDEITYPLPRFVKSSLVAYPVTGGTISVGILFVLMSDKYTKHDVEANAPAQLPAKCSGYYRPLFDVLHIRTVAWRFQTPALSVPLATFFLPWFTCDTSKRCHHKQDIHCQWHNHRMGSETKKATRILLLMTIG